MHEGCVVVGENDVGDGGSIFGASTCWFDNAGEVATGIFIAVGCIVMLSDATNTFASSSSLTSDFRFLCTLVFGPLFLGVLYEHLISVSLCEHSKKL
jgi:hypothetical protein